MRGLHTVLIIYLRPLDLYRHEGVLPSGKSSRKSRFWNP